MRPRSVYLRTWGSGHLSRLLLWEPSPAQVSSAEDGNVAVSMALERRFDIVLMDLRLPGVDGFTTFREIRKVDPLAKVTGHRLEKPIKEAVMGGAYPVMTQPVDPYAILTLINQVAGEGETDERASQRPNR